MAQLTPAEILAISEPIENIYQRTVDELLINIAHHFNISGWERTRYWEIKKLSEMGALTKESAQIIAQNTKMLPEEIEKAFLQVAEKACLDIDPQLRAAAEKGILQDPGTSPSTSVLMRDSIRSYVAQAQDTLNMVNTTMLQSTREAYLRGIATAVSEAQLQEAKEVLETQALEVVTGQETRVRAIRKAMNQLSATGITGFYDRSGRKWHAESYAAMVVRSTSHNAAIQAIKTRQQEFGGGDIFQVSSHNGARPLCFPYQGKFYSWSAGPGEFEDGSGHTRRYENIDQTSYGEPAGLFGINCGHHPIPMIPGFSYPQEGPTQTKAENDKEYKESQTQRAYARPVREAKRDLEIAKATGDEEAIKDAKQKVAQEQAKIRAYVAETGRARRYDREQIPGGKEYEGYKGYRQMRNSDIPANPISFEPSQEGNAIVAAMYDNMRKKGGFNLLSSAEVLEINAEFFVDYDPKKISKESAQAFNNALNNLNKKYVSSLQRIEPMSAQEALTYKTVPAYVFIDYDVSNRGVMRYNPLIVNNTERFVKEVKTAVEKGQFVKVAEKDYINYVAVHESAHTLIGTQNKIPKSSMVGGSYEAQRAAQKELKKIYDEYIFDVARAEKKYKDLEKEALDTFDPDIWDRAAKAKEKLDKIVISKYSLKDPDEFTAESYVNISIGTSKNEYAKRAVEVLDKYFSR